MIDEPFVFVSHASVDKPRVRPLVERLLGDGLWVFVDEPRAFDPPLKETLPW